MTTITVTFVVDEMPENHAQALLALREYTRKVVHCGTPQDLTVTNVQVHLPTMYTLIGVYSDDGQGWTETIPGRTVAEAAALAPKGVRVIAAIEDVDNNEVLIMDPSKP